MGDGSIGNSYEEDIYSIEEQKFQSILNNESFFQYEYDNFRDYETSYYRNEFAKRLPQFIRCVDKYFLQRYPVRDYSPRNPKFFLAIRFKCSKEVPKELLKGIDNFATHHRFVGLHLTVLLENIDHLPSDFFIYLPNKTEVSLTAKYNLTYMPIQSTGVERIYGLDTNCKSIAIAFLRYATEKFQLRWKLEKTDLEKYLQDDFSLTNEIGDAFINKIDLDLIAEKYKPIYKPKFGSEGSHITIRFGIVERLFRHVNIIPTQSDYEMDESEFMRIHQKIDSDLPYSHIDGLEFGEETNIYLPYWKDIKLIQTFWKLGQDYISNIKFIYTESYDGLTYNKRWLEGDEEQLKEGWYPSISFILMGYTPGVIPTKLIKQFLDASIICNYWNPYIQIKQPRTEFDDISNLAKYKQYNIHFEINGGLNADDLVNDKLGEFIKLQPVT